MAPEVIAAGTSLCEDSIVSGQKGDVWSLGICILETYLVWYDLFVTVLYWCVNTSHTGMSHMA